MQNADLMNLPISAFGQKGILMNTYGWKGEWMPAYGQKDQDTIGC